MSHPTPTITVSFQPTKIKLFSSSSSRKKSLLVIEGECINGAINRVRPGNKALIHVRQSTSTTVASDVSELSNLLLVDEEQSIVQSLKKGRWVDIKSPKQIVVKSFAHIERNRRGDRLIECIELLAVLNEEEICLPTNLDSEYNEFIVDDDNTINLNPIQLKSQRHQIFAHWLVETYGKELLSIGTGVIDVAGGNGTISKTLAELGIQSTLLDPNPRCYSDFQKEDDLPFQVIPHPLNGDGSDLTSRDDDVSHTIKNCSLICGLHPDQATEPIVTLALILDVPFAIA